MSSTKILLKQAREVLDAGDLDGALSLCRRVLTVDHTSYQAYLLVGVAATRKGETNRAVQAYERAIALKPEVPLAHKGLIDALSVNADTEDKSLLLRRSRAHAQLASLSPPHAAKSRAEAASAFRVLAAVDSALVPEAIEAWRALQSDELTSIQDGATHVASAVAAIAASGAGLHCGGEDYAIFCNTPLSAYEAYESGPLCDALDSLEAMKSPIGMFPLDRSAHALLVDRLFRRVRSGAHTFEQAVDVLRSLQDLEAILCLIEDDSCVSAAPDDDDFVRAIAAEASTSRPSDAPQIPRSTAALAMAKFLDQAQNCGLPQSDVAVSVLDAMLQAQVSIISPSLAVLAPLQSVVIARLQLAASEYKRCIATAEKGMAICIDLGNRVRVHSVLQLIAASAYYADGKFDSALTSFESGLNRIEGLAQGIGDARRVLCGENSRDIVLAFQRGMVLSCAATGRRDCLTEISTESFLLATMEALWSAALRQEYDIMGMEDLVSKACESATLAASKSSCGVSALTSWEFKVLGEPILGHPNETAAIACMRLAQMIMATSGYLCASQQRAKTLLMQAATLLGSLPGPYALLGWVFELEAQGLQDHGQISRHAVMVTRATRCYRKCVKLDASHPLAARRLACILARDGDENAAVTVALGAASKNPRCKWAWNLLGWSRLRRHAISESESAFQSALRDSTGVDTFAVDAVMGTSVGVRDYMIDVDSLRGLSFVYRRQRRLVPSCSCLESAIDLLASNMCSGKKLSPEVYETLDVRRLVLLHDICAVKTQLGKSAEAIADLLPYATSHIADSKNLPPFSSAWPDCMSRAGYHVGDPVTYICIGESFLALANDAWESGWFYRATALRAQAASWLSTGASRALQLSPHLLPSSAYKRVGDALCSAITQDPCGLAMIVPEERVFGMVECALSMHARARHYKPWMSDGGKDLGCSLLLESLLKGKQVTARMAVEILLDAGADFVCLSAAFLIAENLQGCQVSTIARDMMVHVLCKSGTSGEEELVINAFLASSTPGIDAESRMSHAIIALRHDPSDWRAWVALACIRETNGVSGRWTERIAIKATMNAWAEAERLGGGPGVILRLAESLQRQVFNDSSCTGDEATVEQDVVIDAASANALSCRSGNMKSALCSDVVAKSLQSRANRAIDDVITGRPGQAERVQLLSLSTCLHVFPWNTRLLRAFGDASLISEK
jgi:tetratricopeptide (TPR) repeat protein